MTVRLQDTACSHCNSFFITRKVFFPLPQKRQIYPTWASVFLLAKPAIKYICDNTAIKCDQVAKFTHLLPTTNIKTHINYWPECHWCKTDIPNKYDTVAAGVSRSLTQAQCNQSVCGYELDGSYFQTCSWSEPIRVCWETNCPPTREPITL